MKYKSHITEVEGIRFHSKKEASRYLVLANLEKEGKIKGLKLQPKFTLIPKSKHGREIRYIADFEYYLDDGTYVVEDVKGFRTDVYRLKKRLLAEKTGIEIVET